MGYIYCLSRRGYSVALSYYSLADLHAHPLATYQTHIGWQLTFNKVEHRLQPCLLCNVPATPRPLDTTKLLHHQECY